MPLINKPIADSIDRVEGKDDRSHRATCRAATFRIALIRFSSLWPLQNFSTFFLLLVNVPKSTTGMFRSALK